MCSTATTTAATTTEVEVEPPSEPAGAKHSIFDGLPVPKAGIRPRRGV